MKFKTILTDPTCMKDFYSIIVTLAKISKRAVCNIKSSGMGFSNVGGATVNSVPLVWANVGAVDFFEQFSMDGVDDKFKEIWLTFCPEQLANALNVLKYSIKSIKMKLTKKQFPCLSIDIEVLSTNLASARRLVHDVPVTVIPTREWVDYQFPKLPKFHMSIQLPTLRSLRSLLDKMKNLAPALTICSASNGDLSFIVETDSAMVVSRYYNLMLENTDGDGTPRANDGGLVEVTCLVDSKQLAMCCASMQFGNIRMVGSLVQDEQFNINIRIRDNVSMHCKINTVDE